jgi:hypothetical protein
MLISPFDLEMLVEAAGVEPANTFAGLSVRISK